MLYIKQRHEDSAGKAEDRLGTMRFKEQRDGEYPGFFCLIYVSFEAGKTGNPEMPVDTNKRPWGELAVSGQSTREGAA